MCFDLSDKKLMHWSISIGSCANMRYNSGSEGTLTGFFRTYWILVIYLFITLHRVLLVVTTLPLSLGSKRAEFTQFLFILKFCVLFKILQGFQSGPAKSPQFTHIVKWSLPNWKKNLPKSADIVNLLQAAMPQKLYRTILHFHKL